MKGWLSSPAILAMLAVMSGVVIAGFLIFAAREPESRGTTGNALEREIGAARDSQPQQPKSDALLWIAVLTVGALTAYIGLIKFPREMRKTFVEIQKLRDESAVSQQRMRAADELRDALAVFNRQAFEGGHTADGLVPLYKAMSASRVNLQKRNSRFMYDAVGASHIQAAQRMLNDLDEDLSRDWPHLFEALQTLPAHPGEDEISKLQRDRSYAEALTYVRTLQAEIRKEVEHAELRLRRLLGEVSWRA